MLLICRAVHSRGVYGLFRWHRDRPHTEEEEQLELLKSSLKEIDANIEAYPVEHMVPISLAKESRILIVIVRTLLLRTVTGV